MMQSHRCSIVLAAIVLLLVSMPLGAQPMRPGTPNTANGGAGLDTLRLVYGFQPGGSVTYRVVTRDTLYFHGVNGFHQTAERTMHVTYRCDSVTRDGMVLNVRYDGYVAQERRDTIGPITRTSHPWTNRSFSMLVNDDGRRIRFVTPRDSTLAAGVGPGGPFHPMQLPYLGEQWTHVGASELFDLSHWLLDNAAPATLFTGKVFRTVQGRVDTFGLKTIELAFGETGRATYRAENGSETVGVLNSASQIWFSPLLGFPVAGVAETGANLTLKMPGGAEAGGRQKIHTNFEMIIGDQSASVEGR